MVKTLIVLKSVGLLPTEIAETNAIPFQIHLQFEMIGKAVQLLIDTND